jgi:HK97 family phage prohead protease
VSAESTERLHQYWVHGKGAAKIAWGTPGDFGRCTAELGKYISDAKGYCDLAHHAALGIWPAQHAAMDKKATGRSAVTDTMHRADKKPYGDVTYADPKNGKYPVDTEEHARAAWSYINMPKNSGQYPMNGVTLSEVKDRIMAACKKFGIDVSGGSASRAVQEIRRDCQLEDIHIVRTAEGDSSGRVVEAYASVFDQPAEIRDHQGHYTEVIDRGSFNDVLARIRRNRSGLAAAVKVLYNHGKTMEGEPAPEFQKPLGKPLFIEPESRGLLTRTEYSKTALADEVLELIRDGAITNQSFVGAITRSDPELRGPGDKHRARNGVLPVVRRTVLGLREFGPVLWAAYSGAEILGVRMQLPGSPGEVLEDFDVPLDEEYDPDKEAVVAGSVPADTTTARYHQHALYRMTSEEKRKAVGLVW